MLRHLAARAVLVYHFVAYSSAQKEFPASAAVFYLDVDEAYMAVHQVFVMGADMVKPPCLAMAVVFLNPTSVLGV